MGVTSNWCHPQGHHARRPPTTVPKTKKRSAISCYGLGAKESRIFDSFTPTEIPDRNKPSDIWDAFQTYFDPKTIFWLARPQLHKMWQNPDELINSFVTSLRILGQKCNFKDMNVLDEQLIDEVIKGSYNIPIHKKLLEHDVKTVTLPKCVDMACTSGATHTQLLQLSIGGGETTIASMWQSQTSAHNPLVVPPVPAGLSNPVGGRGSCVSFVEAATTSITFAQHGTKFTSVVKVVVVRIQFAQKICIKKVAKSQQLSDLNRWKHWSVTFDEGLNLMDDIPSDDDSCGDYTLGAPNNQKSPPTHGESEGDKKPSCGIERYRIINVKYVAEQLDAGCLACSQQPLTLSDIRDEQVKGIACTWYAECRACGAICHVHTSKQHAKNNKNPGFTT